MGKAEEPKEELFSNVPLPNTRILLLAAGGEMRSQHTLCQVQAICLSRHGCVGDSPARPPHGASANLSCILDVVWMGKERHCLNGQIRWFPDASQHL